MKNGDINDFLDQLNYGGELVFEYAGSRYFIQGWTTTDRNFMALDYVRDEVFKNYIWTHEASTMKECADAFLSEPLWEGKNFLQIQDDVTWTDW